jgi:hypothetical protein
MGGGTHGKPISLPGPLPPSPFKYHAEHRHHIPKPRYRVTNWAEHDASLRQRGSLTVWSPTRRSRRGGRSRELRQAASGYNLRARIEVPIGRYKRMIGDALRSGTDRTEATEVAIAAASLNRMLRLGRPNYVRID